LVDGTREPDAVYARALDGVRSAFALLMTSVGIPMFLAGEEFGDVHDLDHTDWRLKMSDPVDWARAERKGHRRLREAVGELIRLRTGHEALRVQPVEFFYFHPDIDSWDGVRAFAYWRTGGRKLGDANQVAVVANLGPHDFDQFSLPWPWSLAVVEHAAPSGEVPLQSSAGGLATLSLRPFQVRVFTT
jgi:1,4-alpha-glucan branching enzyme